MPPVQGRAEARLQALESKTGEGWRERDGMSQRARWLIRNARRRWRLHARREQIAIYYYHGVLESRTDNRLERHFHLASDFRDQLRLFRRTRIMALPEVAEELQRPARRRTGGVAITFDDGFANNLLAHEILADFNLPWALFVTTGPADRRTTLWSTELALLLLHGEASGIDIGGRHWPLADRPEREAAFNEIRRKIKRLPSAERVSAMADLQGQFPAAETERLLARFPSMQMLAWHQIKMINAQGVEIGSHGVNHELHNDAQHPQTRIDELAHSKTEIEAHLGKPCSYFAFPNGDAAATSSTEVAAAGYRLAFTTDPRPVANDDSLFLLPRMTSADL